MAGCCAWRVARERRRNGVEARPVYGTPNPTQTNGIVSGKSPRTWRILKPASAVRRLRLGMFGVALSVAACGSGGIVPGTTKTPAGGPGPTPPASGVATLDWTSVTENTDGAVLTDLAGYKVYYGSSESTLNVIVLVPNPTVTTYLVTDLTPGTWYFGVKAYTSEGTESALSNIGQKAIP